MKNIALSPTQTPSEGSTKKFRYKRLDETLLDSEIVLFVIKFLTRLDL